MIIDFNKIPLDDPEVYKQFSFGNTVGIFQFSGYGMIDFLRKLKPEKEDYKKYHNDWMPDMGASMILRNRIVERLQHPLNGKPGKDYHRYKSSLIGNFDNFCDTLHNSELYRLK